MDSTLIAIVEPQPVTLIGISKLLLDNQFNNFNGFRRISDLLEIYKGLGDPPKLIILEIYYPDKEARHPLDTIFNIKEVFSRGTKVLVFTSLSDPQIVSDAIRLGVDGYVLKTQEEMDLIEAVKRINNGKKYFSNEVAESLATIITHGFNSEPKNVKNEIEENISRLTQREKQVLALVGQGLKNEEIAERLYVDPRTVSTHKQNIKQKFKLRDSTDLLRYAMEVAGWLINTIKQDL